MLLSNKVKQSFINYAEAFNNNINTDNLFNSFIDQLESEYDYETSEKVMDLLCRCGKSEAGNDIILTEANLRYIETI